MPPSPKWHLEEETLVRVLLDPIVELQIMPEFVNDFNFDIDLDLDVEANTKFVRSEISDNIENVKGNKAEEEISDDEQLVDYDSVVEIYETEERDMTYVP
ncbi:hypothetical protein QVD17_00091 [Tagetes erecta]|uniref:Uncharacterized protein n=1 Tax=Tagetes erecta TaxID=13708 RepID=A0AAD8L9H9_TARER|nr:hypothetical protein QVD17_00091 [Tagetes erecta]